MIEIMSPSPLVGRRVTQLPAELQPRAIRRGTVAIQPVEIEPIELQIDGEPDAEDEIASWRVLEAARTAQPSDLARSPRSMIKEAEKRSWRVSATVARGAGPARRKIEVDGEKVFRTVEIEITSVKVRFVSPFDDVLVAVWTTPDEPKATAEVKAWAYTRGVTRPLDIATAKKWIIGPWEDLMENSGFVPAWKRALADEAKRKASHGQCSGCGAFVIHGLDQLDQVIGDPGQPVVVDATPLEGPLKVLAEVACFLGDRPIFSLLRVGGGIELHRREDWDIGTDRYPAYVAHRCGAPIELRSAA